jgi:outer membrane protein TolC
MQTIRSATALLCVSLLLAPLAVAQEAGYAWQGRQHDWITDPYRAKEIPPADMSNSPRLEQLLRAGNLYLSLQDAIALAIENNLDVEVARYGPQIGQADLMRAKAGGLLRGVPTSVSQGASSVQAQVTGDTTGAGGGGAGGAGGGGGATATEAGGAVITQTGVATQVLDPRLFLTYSASHRSSPQVNTTTTGVTALTSDSHFGNLVFQKNFLTGTSFDFSWNGAYFKSNNLLANLNPGYQGAWSINISQNLLQGFGRAVNGRNILVATNNLRVSDLVFEQQIIATVSSVVKLYWDLVTFSEDVDVRQQALALAQRLYEDNQRQVEIGTLAPIEIVSAEAQVARRQQELLVAQTRLLQQESVIKNELSKNGVANPTIKDARIIPTDRISVPDEEEVRDLSSMVETALSDRPEIEQTQINLENTRIGMRGSRNALRPSLGVTFSATNNGLAGTANPDAFVQPDAFFIGGYGTVLGQILRRNFPDYSLGVQLNIPLRNRSAQADYVRDMLSMRQAELREQRQLNAVRLSVQNAEIAVRQARALYDATVQERILQEQTLDAEQKRYALGASTVFFVIQYQNDLASARANEVSALASYAKAKVDLDQAVGRTLDVYNINLDEALDGEISRPPSPLPPQQ